MKPIFRGARTLALLPLALILLGARAEAGTWAPVNAGGAAPSAVAVMLLLPDGTVLASEYDNSGTVTNWFLLSPDSSGHYVDGTWTELSPMHDSRFYFASQVLPDGRVFVAGGEYGSGRGSAEIYDPTADALNPWHGSNTALNPWTYINPPTSLLNPADSSPSISGNQGFVDSTSETFSGGNVIIAPVGPSTYGGTLVYKPVANQWSFGGTLVNSAFEAEASWVKLPDGSSLTIDPYGQKSERFIPAASGTGGTWTNDGNVPVPIYNSLSGEEGGATLLPNRKAFFQGGTGNTVLYTPSGSASPGTWVQGPSIPQGLAPIDAPVAMMPNGKVLMAEGPKSVSGDEYPSPTSFFEYDYSVGASGSFTEVGAPFGTAGGPNNKLQEPQATYISQLLVLPDGTVICSGVSSSLYIYTPDANTNPTVTAMRPTITNITRNSDGSYHLAGSYLTGISEGAAYGDDAQMASNYPIVSLQKGSNVYYARTFGWSSTRVMQTNQTTEFTLPPNLPNGVYSLVVSANGLKSAPTTFAANTIWVDFTSSTAGNGTFEKPYITMAAGVSAAASGGTIEIKKPGHSLEKPTISKPVTIVVYNGPATIGSAAPVMAKPAEAASPRMTAAKPAAKPPLKPVPPPRRPILRSSPAGH